MSPLLLPLTLFFLLAPAASSQWLLGKDKNESDDYCCNLDPSSEDRKDTTDGRLVVPPFVVSSTGDAASLARDLLCCPGAIFEVEWEGQVGIEESLEVVHGTSLTITGASRKSTAAAVLGGEQMLTPSSLFSVNESSTLYLEGLALTGGGGARGGAVAAYGSSSVTLVDCAVSGNAVTDSGGAIYLEESALLTGGTSFRDNTADKHGGAIHASVNSTVTTRDGSTGNVFQNNSAKSGGAFHLDGGSNLTLAPGGTLLSNNLGREDGGAIYAKDRCRVDVLGTAVFAGNQARSGDGGAIQICDDSKLIAEGSTSFIDNISGHVGGAILAHTSSIVRISSEATFSRNIAVDDGGAIRAQLGSYVWIDGRAVFEGNLSGGYGGAFSGFDKAKFKTAGETLFTGNTAQFGGGIHGHKSVSTYLGGDLRFINNTAAFDGGAIYLSKARLKFNHIEPYFGYNNALEGSGGAMYFSSVPDLTIRNASLVGNVAVWGGGVASFSSGNAVLSTSTDATSFLDGESDTTSHPLSSSSEASTSDSSVTPVHVFDCWFEDNLAWEDGGGMYSVAEYDVIRGSTFVGNRAESSGGALVHAGVMEEVSGTVFRGNSAGNEGPAVLSLGIVQTISNVTFECNVFYCNVGTYSREAAISPSEEEEKCRFIEVCSRCSATCGSTLEAGAVLENSESIPSCEAVPMGTATTTRGGTIETLYVQPGYYRHSLTSTDLRECFLEEACQGGVLQSDYCAPGYTGPYCAVCAEDYAPGYHHACKSCLGESRQLALATMGAVTALVLMAVVVVVAWLVSVVEPSLDAKNQPSRLTQQLVDASQWRVWQKFPLAAVKIVVVMWQVVSQFSSMTGVEYPGPYETFLSYVDVVNLDVGFVLSLACVYDTNFYDRLIIATTGPAIIIAVLGATYLVALRRNNHHSRNSSGRSSFFRPPATPEPSGSPGDSLPNSPDVRSQHEEEEQLQQRQQELEEEADEAEEAEEVLTVIQNRHLSVALFVLFVVYATVSYIVFQTFVCDGFEEGTSYLRADYRLECNTARHYRYRVYAALMIIVYPVGIPLALGWWLFRHREDLRAPDRKKNSRIRPAADLWGSYTRERYYYEVVECFRRVALTGLAVFIYPDSSAQLAIVLLLATFFMVLSEVLSPFARSIEMWLYRAGHYVIFASMYLALLLRVDVSNERAQSQEIFSGVLIATHVAMALVVLAQGLIMFLGWEDPREGEKRPSQNTALRGSLKALLGGRPHVKTTAKVVAAFPCARPRGGKTNFNIDAIYDDDDKDKDNNESFNFNPIFQSKREEVEEEDDDDDDERQRSVPTGGTVLSPPPPPSQPSPPKPDDPSKTATTSFFGHSKKRGVTINVRGGFPDTPPALTSGADDGPPRDSTPSETSPRKQGGRVGRTRSAREEDFRRHNSGKVKHSSGRVSLINTSCGSPPSSFSECRRERGGAASASTLAGADSSSEEQEKEEEATVLHP